MRFLIALAAAAGLVAVAATISTASAERPSAHRGTVWAVERFDGGVNTLSAFDAASGELLGTMPVGRRPIGVAVPRGTGKVYTADERSNQLTVVSKRSFATGEPDVHRIPTGTFPHHLMASTNGHRLYVGEYGTNKVGVVDTRLDSLVAEWDASANPAARTHAVWITPRDELYATNEGATQAATGTLSKLDADTGELLWEVPIGSRPSEVLVTPNGRTAYVTVRNENVVKILDVSGDAPVQTGTVTIGGMPDTMQLTHDGTLVVGLRSTPQLALLDTDTLAVRHVAFQGYGISGHQWVSRDGRLTYVALEALTPAFPGAIAVVENATGAVLDTWPYPAGPWPHGVVYEPATLGVGGDEEG